MRSRLWNRLAQIESTQTGLLPLIRRWTESRWNSPVDGVTGTRVQRRRPSVPCCRRVEWGTRRLTCSSRAPRISHREMVGYSLLRYGQPLARWVLYQSATYPNNFVRFLHLLMIYEVWWILGSMEVPWTDHCYPGGPKWELMDTCRCSAMEPWYRHKSQ